MLVEQHHRLARTKLPNLTIHAAFHAIVENQIALGMEPVLRAMARLTNDGLTRHDAVHAIASVATENIYDILNAKDDATTSQARYNAAVERLTAKNWRGGQPGFDCRNRHPEQRQSVRELRGQAHISIRHRQIKKRALLALALIPSQTLVSGCAADFHARRKSVRSRKHPMPCRNPATV